MSYCHCISNRPYVTRWGYFFFKNRLTRDCDMHAKNIM